MGEESFIDEVAKEAKQKLKKKISELDDVFGLTLITMLAETTKGAKVKESIMWREKAQRYLRALKEINAVLVRYFEKKIDAEKAIEYIASILRELKI